MVGWSIQDRAGRWARLALAVLCAAATLCLALPSGAAGEVQPFGALNCVPREAVRFCEGSTATRVKSWDGVPLDVNVTLPAQGDADLPLVVLLHGWGGRKDGFSASRPWAERGFAVLAYTARGFGESCGSLSSRAADPAGCARGWIHLADTRYEARDTQFLAGLLADQGLVRPRIGVTGISYGGGQSLALATLRNRVMLPDGAVVPWTSPGGIPMEIAAAAPVVPWSDLVYSLLPNGRTLDNVLTGPTDDLSPLGVKKESYVDGLFASGANSGYYAPPGADPDADLVTWFARVNAGEPEDPTARAIADEIAHHHSGYYLYLDHPTTPAPLLISNGFTDDLFPANEALRYANRVQAERPDATIAQMHFDYGHPRGQNKPADVERLRQAIYHWLEGYVKGDATVTTLTGVEALTQTCPASAPSGGPFRDPTWSALHPGEVRFGEDGSQTVVPRMQDPAVGTAIDPIAGRGACATVSAAGEPGTAAYVGPRAKDGYTLLGSPTVVAEVSPGDRNSQLAARLWDVAPDGSSQTLVARALYRPATAGRQVFQLHPNGWRFEPGHRPKLQLLSQDAPYARPSNAQVPLTVSDVQVRLPVNEAPGSVAQVRSPLPLR
jgi:hypothetical protein